MVHGIGQENCDEATLTADWIGWLRSAMPYPQVLDDTKVRMPFYGKALVDSIQRLDQIDAVAQGLEPTDMDELNFVANAMEEAAHAAHLSPRDIAIEQRVDGAQPVEQSLLMHRKVNAVARLLERVSPFHGRLVLPLVRQAYAYLRKPGVAEDVDRIVLPALLESSAVIVAHSLGTVVTFKLLRKLASEGRNVGCPLYITLGSPLALRAVSAALGAPFEVPQGVAHWANFVEPNDSVTLGKELDANSFCGGIENVMDVANTSSDSPHHVMGYLKDRRLAARVERALADSVQRPEVK